MTRRLPDPLPDGPPLMTDLERLRAVETAARRLVQLLTGPGDVGDEFAYRLGDLQEALGQPAEEAALVADGLRYGTAGRPLSSLHCRFCWGTHEVWFGNRWSPKHRDKPPGISCKHACHRNDGPAIAAEG